MKTIDITFKNHTTVINRTLAIDGSMNKSRLIGTTCTDLFRLVKLQVDGHAKLFNLSKPFDVVIEFDGKRLDTVSLPTILKTKFKLNKTKKRQRKFAMAIYAVVDWATTDTKSVTMAELTETLKEI